MEHFIGIDNSSLDHKIRVIDEKGKQKLSFSITNTMIIRREEAKPIL